MNGRVYDPTIARFISADPNIFHPFDTQDFNRYTYVRNNPLYYTDPTGYAWDDDDDGSSWSDWDNDFDENGEWDEANDVEDGSGVGSVTGSDGETAYYNENVNNYNVQNLDNSGFGHYNNENFTHDNIGQYGAWNDSSGDVRAGWGTYVNDKTNSGYYTGSYNKKSSFEHYYDNTHLNTRVQNQYATPKHRAIIGLTEYQKNKNLSKSLNVISGTFFGLSQIAPVGMRQGLGLAGSFAGALSYSIDPDKNNLSHQSAVTSLGLDVQDNRKGWK